MVYAKVVADASEQICRRPSKYWTNVPASSLCVQPCREDTTVKPKKTARARKGELVLIHIVVLQPGARAANLPEATRSASYEGWVKGFLLEDQAVIGETVRIKSFIGREITGALAEINPSYDHNFGEPQPALSRLGLEAWEKLESRG